MSNNDNFLCVSLGACSSDKDGQCQELLKMEREMSRKLPMKVDEATTLVEFSVNCSSKTVKYVKHLSVSGNRLNPGFQERKQRQYVNLHCNRNGLATNGWTATDYIYDKNLNLVMKLKATPSMGRNY